MFCFCLQSSLLKLQAMDVDGGPSLQGPSSPEEGCTAPPLGGKEQRSPCGGGGGGGGGGLGPGVHHHHHHGIKEGPPPTAALCHGVYPADENSPPELFNRPPQSPQKTLSPKTHQPLAPLQPCTQSCYPLQPLMAGDGEHPQSPRPVAYAPLWASLGGGGASDGGGGGGDGGGGGVGGGLVHLLAGGHSPLPSPRCSALSLRFSSDPDDAPSPPCNQPYMLSRGLDRAEGSEVTAPPSIPLLTRHIQALKRKVRKFEEHFEREMNYKPSYNDKSANPEIIRAMTELAKARKQLKELKLRQSIFELKDQEAGGDATGQQHADVCRYGASQQGAPELQQHTPTLEETVESLFKRLREKRQALAMPENVKEMTQAQMVVEKMILQKCLLYFESVHGRAGSKQPDSLVKSLYDRYQMIKRLLCASPTFTIIEEEEGSDDDYAVSYEAVPPPQRVTRPAANEEDSDHDGDPAFVSPIDEVKAIRQQQAFNMANLHEASRSELLQCLRETRSEKKRSRKVLREFEEEFQRQTGRICQKEDRSPMAAEYQEYKHLKAKLRLLEVLLTKQEVTKSSPNRK